MIRELVGLFSENTINGILGIIVERYRDYIRLTNSDAFKRLFSEEYKPHNGQFSISWAISSGFPSGSKVCDDLQVECYIYSKGFTRPLLSNERIKIMVLNKTTHFDADYLKKFYLLNSNRSEGCVRFCYFKFSVDNNKLKQVSLCYPDEYGKTVEEELLCESQIELLLLVA